MAPNEVYYFTAGGSCSETIAPESHQSRMSLEPPHVMTSEWEIKLTPHRPEVIVCAEQIGRARPAAIRLPGSRLRWCYSPRIIQITATFLRLVITCLPKADLLHDSRGLGPLSSKCRNAQMEKGSRVFISDVRIRQSRTVFVLLSGCASRCHIKKAVECKEGEQDLP